MVHLGDQHDCPLCGLTLNSKMYLQSHIQNIHTKTKKVKCDICGKELNSCSLQYHKEVIHKIHEEKTYS